MSSVQFVKDLKRGRVAEEYVAGMFRFNGAHVQEAPDTNFPDYDLKINGHTVEVKYDWLAEKTGNLCLELEALWHSRAEWLAIVTDNPRTVYLTPLQEALRLAQAWPIKKEVGEFSLVAALIPKADFIARLNPQVLTV